MSILNTPQANVIALFKSSSPRSRLYARLGYAPNTVKSVAADSKKKVKWNLEVDIADAVEEIYGLPWPLAAEKTCRQIKRAVYEEDWQQLSDNWGALLGADMLAGLDSKPWEEYAGHLAIRYSYWTGVLIGQKEVGGKEQIEHYRQLTEKMIGLLAGSDVIFARLLRLKIAINAVAIEWNYVPRKDRATSQRLQKLMDDRQFFKSLYEYTDLCNDLRAVLNGIACASGRSLREEFPRLRDLARKFNDGHDPELPADDSDFDVYKDWQSQKKGERS